MCGHLVWVPMNWDVHRTVTVSPQRLSHAGGCLISSVPTLQGHPYNHPLITFITITDTRYLRGKKSGNVLHFFPAIITFFGADY